MPSFMRPLHSQTYALMRIVAGLLFMWHGTQKLLEFLGSPPTVPSFVTYIAGPIELVGGLLVAVGLFAGWAAFFCSGLMAAAYWMVHGTQALFPIVNGGELAALYCFVFLYIAAEGSGIWSVDAARGLVTPNIHSESQWQVRSKERVM
ncbi:MAG: DoxX family protein [Nitrospira sp.]|nr:DoxX family protein [Nitrospira sp.]